jgi:hypothetical protein
MTWLWVIIVVAIIGGVWGLLSSKDDEKGEGCISGFFGAGMGCGYIILQIFLSLLSLYILFKIGCWLFS